MEKELSSPKEAGLRIFAFPSEQMQGICQKQLKFNTHKLAIVTVYM